MQDGSFDITTVDCDAENTDIILRRGINLGCVKLGKRRSQSDQARQLWEQNRPIFLPAMLAHALPQYVAEIARSKALYDAVINEAAVEDLLDSSPYVELLANRFQILSSRFDEADPQEIISVDFDVMDGDMVLMEDIWMRISWLSFHEEDASCRFRFSFGMENFDDVSEDPQRQLAAAELSQRIFPESAIVTEHASLRSILNDILKVSSFHFVERIIYFNAKNGGAQFHHDAEKGHLGVVYAQVSGETFWLALSREQLMDEITLFMSDADNVNALKADMNDDVAFQRFVRALKQNLSEVINDPANEEISVLLNESRRFFGQLVTRGYAYHLEAGDVILLPQATMDDCAWHSVFCVGDEAGEALSFAIKAA